MKKVGIIGCGGIARVHTWALGTMKGVCLKAFCDIDLLKAMSLAETTKDAKSNKPVKGSNRQDILVTEDWKALCDADLDAVHLCTPHYLHVPMALELLRSGKAVFMEKPCGISKEEFMELKAEAERHPGKLGFCFQNRYNETTLLIDEMMKEGRIGKLLGGRAMVTWRRDEEYYRESAWKGKLATEGGGALINQSIHTLDLLLRYLGDPVTVRSTASNHHLSQTEIEVEDTVEAWLEFKEGKRACFYASNAYAADAPVYLELQGEAGRICMNGSEVTLYSEGMEPRRYSCEKMQGIGKDYWGCGHKACMESFYRSLESGEPWQNSLSGVENTFLTVMAIYDAARENKESTIQ